MSVSRVARSFLGAVAGLLAIMAAPCVHGAAAGSPTRGDSATTRIVSLVPNLTELTFSLGAGDQVVGVSDYCHYPAAARTRPAVGGLINPGLEATLRLRPTVVLLYRSQTDFAARLGQLGIPVQLFQVDTLADMQTAIGRLGGITGRTTAAAELAENINAALDAVETSATAKARSANEGESARVSGVVIVSRDPSGLGALYQASAGHFLGQLFQLAGGRLALPQGAALSREDIIRANPDVIIDMSGSSRVDVEAADDGGEAAKPRRDVGVWSQLSTVAAVRNGRVYQWADPHATLLGPSVVRTARVMWGVLWGV